MGSIWLICCEGARYARVKREVLARDPAAQILRASNVDELAALVAAFPQGGVSAALFSDVEDAAYAEAAVAELARANRLRALLVIVAVLDPAHIARLFYAGATEVIAAEDVVPEAASDSDRLCMEGKAAQGITAETADETDPGTPHATHDAPQELDKNHSSVSQGLACEPVAERRGGASMPSGTGEMPVETASSYVVPVPAVGAPSFRDDELDEPEPRGLGAPATPKPAGSADDARTSAAMRAAAPEPASADVPSTAALEPPRPAELRELARGAADSKAAPVITVVAGRGGCGKTTLTASMAACSAALGMRTAVVDLDLMFGNLHELFGVDAPGDLASLATDCRKGYLAEADVLRAAARVGPGLTLWGPLSLPEQAEIMGDAVQMLLETLRRESDVVFVDTSAFWGDAAARAVALSSRCLVVGDGTAGSAAAAAKVIDLACRVGVPRTRMVSVLNRFGTRACTEEQAMRFEMKCALSSKRRIADGGGDAAGLMAYGDVEGLVRGQGAFAGGVRAFTQELLVELGCAVGTWPGELQGGAAAGDRPRLKLPWKKGEHAWA